MNRLVRLKKETMTTSQFEQRIEAVKATILRYRTVEKSEELKEYLDLKKIVDTPEFQQRKNYLLKRKYRETEEGKTMARYRRAKRFPSTQKYLAIADSGVKDNMVFKKTQAWRLQLPLVKDYLRLDTVVNEEDFKQRDAFWKNPKRWYTLPESQQDARYQELSQSEDIRFFYAQDPKQIAAWENYKTLWSDEMEWMTMKDSDWQAGFYYTNKNLKRDHSYFNEQQANNSGRNTVAVNSVLQVEVKPEFVHAPAWHPTKGFVEKEFTYTADTLQTAERFQAKEGLFLAKARVVGGAHASLYLATGERLPLLTMMHWNGQKVSMGIKTTKIESTVTIPDIKANQWFVYGLQVTDRELIWTVNGQEVSRETNTLKGTSFFPAISLFVPEGVKNGIGQIEVDWIRVYKA